MDVDQTLRGSVPPSLSLTVEATGQVSIDLLRPPQEDFGATTSANYHYQTEVIASFCACMPTDSSIYEIICEWHEDFVIVRTGSSERLELVSVKHKDRDDYTTLAQLCIAGGLAHLFDRWLGFSRPTRARLCSNAKLSGKPSEASPRALEEICNSREFANQRATHVVSHLAWAIMDVVKDVDAGTEPFENIPRPSRKPLPKKADRANVSDLPDGMIEALLRFLLMLRFDCGRPDKDHITDTNIRRLVEPAMTHLGYLHAAASVAYSGIVDVVSVASRDHSGRQRDLARYLADPDGDTADAAILATLQRRTVTRDHVLSALKTGATRVPGNTVALVRAGQMPPRSAGGHKLRDKMSLGGIDVDEQENALELRDLWLHTWPQVTTGFPEDIEHQYRLQLEILDVVRAVRSRLVGVSDPFGVQFQAELHKALRGADLSRKCNVPLDDFHIIGYAYELSDICKFGFLRPGSGQ